MIKEFLEEVNRECGTKFRLVSEKKKKNRNIHFSCEDSEHGKIKGIVETGLGESPDRQLRELFAPRLPKRFSSRIRWPILGNPSEKSRNLPPRTGYFYRQFASVSTKNFSYHWADMNRFYTFIVAAHRGGTELTDGDVEELLIEDGFEEKTAEDLANIYNHGREILRSNRKF